VYVENYKIKTIMAVSVKEAVKNAVPEWLQTEILKISSSIKKDWGKGLSIAKREFEIVKDLALVDYNTLRESVGKLNVILRSCENNSIEKVMFGIRVVNCKSVLWKATTRVMCLKVNLQEKKVKVVRILTISEFWRLRSDILEEVRFKNLLDSNMMADFQLIDHHGDVIQDGSEASAITELPIPLALTTSGIFKKVEKVATDESECLICMDNKVGLTLPCAHSFCSECIKTWYNTNQSCPVCRDYLEKQEDCWEFTDLPDLEEINEKVVELATGD